MVMPLHQSTTSTSQPRPKIHKLVFFVPPSHLQVCKTAVFSAGAGVYPTAPSPLYGNTCFETQGTGQFTPLDGASPNIGEVGMLERVQEVRVETIVTGGMEVVRRAVGESRRVHPYEVVAVEVWEVLDIY